MTDISVLVQAGADDARETGDGTGFSSTGTSFSSFGGGTTGGFRCNAGFRFTTGPLPPQGATIDDADFLVVATNTTNDNLGTVHRLFCEDVDSSVDFSATADVISRARTATNSTIINGFNVVSASVHTSLPTGDFAAVVQEVVDRGGYDASAITVLLIHTASGSGVSNGLAIRAYENSTTLCGRLDISYTESAPMTVSVGQATETETTLATAAVHRVSVSQVAETESARAIAAAHRVAVGQVTETETALAITVIAPLVVAVGLVTETESHQLIGPVYALALGQVTESEAAMPVAAARSIPVDQVTETEAAQAVEAAHCVAVGQATETENAGAIAAAKGVAVGKVDETEAALAVSALVATPVIVPVGQVTETEAALAIGRGSYRTEAGSTGAGAEGRGSAAGLDAAAGRSGADAIGGGGGFDAVAAASGRVEAP